MNARPLSLRRGASRPFVFAALVTPFVDGEIDLDGFEENLRFVDGAGLDGALVAGTTGERGRLSPRERDRLVERARRVAANDFLVIAGLLPGRVAVDDAVADAVRAAESGADLILADPPVGPGSELDPSMTVSWYSGLVAACPVPMLAYQPPSYRQAPMTSALIASIAALPGLAGVKDSIGSADAIDDWKRAAPPVFDVFVGSAALYLDDPQRASGAILALASVEPERLLAAATADPSHQKRLAAELTQPLQRIAAGGLAALKELHDERGLFGGPLRAV